MKIKTVHFILQIPVLKNIFRKKTTIKDAEVVNEEILRKRVKQFHKRMVQKQEIIY